MNYEQQFIGLSNGTRVRNFIHFNPRKRATRVNVTVSDAAAWHKRLAEAGLVASLAGGSLRLGVTAADLTNHGPLLRELVHQAVAHYQGR